MKTYGRRSLGGDFVELTAGVSGEGVTNAGSVWSTLDGRCWCSSTQMTAHQHQHTRRTSLDALEWCAMAAAVRCRLRQGHKAHCLGQSTAGSCCTPTSLSPKWWWHWVGDRTMCRISGASTRPPFQAASLRVLNPHKLLAGYPTCASVFAYGCPHGVTGDRVVWQRMASFCSNGGASLQQHHCCRCCRHEADRTSRGTAAGRLGRCRRRHRRCCRGDGRGLAIAAGGGAALSQGLSQQPVCCVSGKCQGEAMTRGRGSRGSDRDDQGQSRVHRRASRGLQS